MATDTTCIYTELLPLAFVRKLGTSQVVLCFCHATDFACFDLLEHGTGDCIGEKGGGVVMVSH